MRAFWHLWHPFVCSDSIHLYDCHLTRVIRWCRQLKLDNSFYSSKNAQNNRNPNEETAEPQKLLKSTLQRRQIKHAYFTPSYWKENGTIVQGSAFSSTVWDIWKPRSKFLNPACIPEITPAHNNAIVLAFTKDAGPNVRLTRLQRELGVHWMVIELHGEGKSLQ